MNDEHHYLFTPLPCSEHVSSDHHHVAMLTACLCNLGGCTVINLSGMCELNYFNNLTIPQRMQRPRRIKSVNFSNVPQYRKKRLIPEMVTDRAKKHFREQMVYFFCANPPNAPDEKGHIITAGIAPGLAVEHVH